MRKVAHAKPLRLILEAMAAGLKGECWPPKKKRPRPAAAKRQARAVRRAKR